MLILLQKEFYKEKINKCFFLKFRQTVLANVNKSVQKSKKYTLTILKRKRKQKIIQDHITNT